MNGLNVQDDMLTVEAFAKHKGMPVEKVIGMIKNGFYSGRLEGDQWFIDSVELSTGNPYTQASAGGHSAKYRSGYATARNLSTFMSIIGWVVVAIGVIVGGIAFIGALRYGIDVFESLELALPDLGISLGGLFMIATAQVTKATVDNADHTREILNVLKARG